MPIKKLCKLSVHHEDKDNVTEVCSSDSAIKHCRLKMAAGDLDEAESLARSALAISKECGEAWYHLGMIAHRRGDNAAALDLLRKAAGYSPFDAEIQNHYGNALRTNGQLDEAIGQYRRAAKLKSDYAAPVYNMGLVQLTLGHPEDAAALFEQSLSIRADFPAALLSLGNLRLSQENYLEAECLFRKAVNGSPDKIEAYNNLAIALTGLKRCDEALDVCKAALERTSGSAELHNTIGIALRETGLLDEAIASYRRALELNPVNPKILNNLGSALREKANFAESISTLKGALTLDPNFAAAWHNLGISLREQGKLDDSIEAINRALELNSAYAGAYNDLGVTLLAQGKIDASVAAYRKSFELNNKSFVSYSNMLLTMHYSSSYTPEDLYRESHRYNSFFSGIRKFNHVNDPEPLRKLRVGYVSADFRSHSVSFFLRALIANHSRAELSIFCYSAVRVPDDHTEFYRESADSWRNICGLAAEEVARLVIEDRIDILVDLGGHTSQNLIAFAYSPAPVQVTWLGYPDTTGLLAMNYRFSDDLADPAGDSDLYCTEKIWRLPGGFLCYSPPKSAPDVSLLPSLSSGVVTFGSFNTIAKITTQVIDLWCAILKKVPDARFVIKDRSMSDNGVRCRYQAMFTARGISPDRVELRFWSDDVCSHLAVYGEIDIALDTFPYNGTTTTCEALWMGVPVVTLAGDRHSGRVGESILSRVGLGDLVAGSPELYIDIAVSLANDLPRLSGIRSTLRQTLLASTLCDGAGFARNVESAYRQMWQLWCDKQGKSNNLARLISN